MKAQNGNKVKLTYVGTLEDGQIFDKTEEGNFFEFTLGAQEVIPGFESQILGMELNEEKEFDIVPEEAYGIVNPQLIFEIPKEQFPEDVNIGDQFELIDGDPNDHENHRHIPITITKIEGDKVTVDANHPLAGHTLHFAVKLIEIK